MRSFVRLFTMAAAGAALLSATALTFEAPRRLLTDPEPTLARLPATAMRSLARSVFPRDAKQRRTPDRIACGASSRHDA